MKIVKTFLLCVLLLGFAGSASAGSFYLNAAGTGFAGATEMTLLNGTSGAYDVNVDLGGNNVLDANDTFTQSVMMQIYGYLPAGSSTTSFFTPQLSAFTSDALGNQTSSSGIIDSYVDGDGVAIDATNASAALLNQDNFSIDFGITSGFYTLTDNSLGSGNIIGIFQIISGGADFIANQNPTPTSDIGLTMVATYLDDGYFFTAGGVDYKDLMLTPGKLVIGLADSSVNVETVTGNPNDNALTFGTTDNGTTIRVNPVPEPATFTLFGISILWVAGIIRRRQKV